MAANLGGTMSQPRPRKRPRTKPVAKILAPIAPAPPTEVSPQPTVAIDREPVIGDEHGYLAIGLATGALAVVSVMIVLIAMAAN